MSNVIRLITNKRNYPFDKYNHMNPKPKNTPKPKTRKDFLKLFADIQVLVAKSGFVVEELAQRTSIHGIARIEIEVEYQYGEADLSP